MHNITGPRADVSHRIRLWIAPGLAAAALVVAGAVYAAGDTVLTRSWLGGAGGRSGAEPVVLKAAIGQPAAGLSRSDDSRLCAGAACPDGEVPSAPEVAAAEIYLPINRLDPE
jgi:hypothetical protein